MSKYNLGLARKIIDRSAELTASQEAKALEKFSSARGQQLSPAATEANQKAYEILKSKDNVRLAGSRYAADAERKVGNYELLEIPDASSARTPLELLQEQKIKDNHVWYDQLQDEAREKVAKEVSNLEAEKAKRMLPEFAQPDEGTKVLDAEPAKVAPKKVSAAIAAPLGFSSTGITNPIDVLKHGYDALVKAKQSVVNKIADVTDMGLNENPYVPQYAKDHYNKAANALVSNVTDPLNAIPGFGVADAVIGAASTGYDMYEAGKKPQTTYVDKAPQNNPTQAFKVKP